jgi:nucleotide-binding universal stress UspA family protein
VSEDDGKVTLDKILVPVDRTPRPDAAIERAMMALAAFGKEDSMLTLLHVGPEGPYPWPTWPAGYRWKSTQLLRQGRPVDAILATAEEQGSDLIILVTDGADGFFDVLRGSTTQQIVRRAPCPVLAIPHDF